MAELVQAGPAAEQPHPVLAAKPVVTAVGSAPGGAAPFGVTRLDEF